MSLRAFLLGLLMVASLLPPSAVAQEPDWNRKFQALAVTPDVAGGSVISAVFSIDAQPSSVPLDLSTLAVLHLNGVPVDSLQENVSFDVVTLPCGVTACSEICGSATLAAGAAALICYEDCPWHATHSIEPGADCDCGIWRSVTFPSVTVSTGDEIMVLLRPAPGALPDPDNSDDSGMATPNGEILYWNRSVESAQMFDVGGGNYDIVASGDVAYNGPVTINLDFDVVVRRNGVDVVEQRVTMRGSRDATDPTCFQVGCGNYCGVINGTSRSCLQAGPWNICSCNAGWIETIPVPLPNLQPADEIMVLLRPAPGAFPEIPPTQFDDAFITPQPQAEPAWNRKVQNVAVIPDGSGGLLLSAHLSVDAQPSSVPLNLSTQVEVQINGTPFATSSNLLVTFNQVDPSCATSSCSGVCGSASLDAGAASLICYEDCPWHATPGIQDCDCGVWLSWESPSLPAALCCHDEIVVILRPAPGALPDSDASDDSSSTFFDGGEIYWNRAITSAQLDWVGGGTSDLEVAGNVAMDGLETANLDFDIVVLRNGIEEFSHPVEQRMLGGGADITCFQVGCGNYCGSRNGIDLTCDTSGPWSACRCGGSWIETFTGVLPGATFEDEIEVILRPVPGALPELPGFPEEDDDRPVDRTSGVEDDVVTLAPRRLLAQNTPNPFNPSTQIAFFLPERGRARLDIFDLQGRHVRTLVDDVLGAGEHLRIWDGTNTAGLRVASGIYSYRLSLQESRQETRKMVLIK